MSAAKSIDAPFDLSRHDRRFFRDRGYIKLRRVLDPQTLRHYGQHIVRQVIARNTMHKPMSERTTYERAFLQVTNLWRSDPVVEEFVRGRRLARIAAELMGVDAVRLYHDQALFKEPGGGITPWHADQYYWPLSTSNTCTAWVPLQTTVREMGPLAFAAGSHRFELGRDLKISDESERVLQQTLQRLNLTEDDEPFQLGDVSFHYGWTFHHTGANVTERPRAVMTIIYMEAEIRLTEAIRPEHVADREAFIPGVKIGAPAASPLNPLLWSTAGSA